MHKAKKYFASSGQYVIVYGLFTACFTMYPDSGYKRAHAQSVCTRPFPHSKKGHAGSESIDDDA